MLYVVVGCCELTEDMRSTVSSQKVFKSSVSSQKAKNGCCELTGAVSVWEIRPTSCELTEELCELTGASVSSQEL